MRHRRFATLIACTLALIGATLFAFAGPASAHHPLLSGTVTCSQSTPSDHVILWSIGNSQPNDEMTITSASAVYNGTNYDVVGYDSPVPGGGSTNATSNLPGNLTGTVTIVVSGIWPDQHTATRSADVSLGDPCFTVPTTAPPTTAPPTTAPPTTGPPPTTTPGTPTTTPGDTPTTIVDGGPPPPSGDGGGNGAPCDPATSPTQCKPLAFTGIRLWGWLCIGLAFVIVGLLFATRRRAGTFGTR